jgi:GxxExxY protein
MVTNPESGRLNAITDKIIGAAIRVHKELGPGILESAYEACLTFELIDLGVAVERQKTLPITYRGRQLDHGYRIDLLVEQSVLVEVKDDSNVWSASTARRSCRTFVCSNLGWALDQLQRALASERHQADRERLSRVKCGSAGSASSAFNRPR